MRLECSGVASGIFNTARQTGSLLGVAVLGAFLGGETHFLRGFHAAVLVAGALVLLGILGTLAWAQSGAAERAPSGMELEEELAAEG